MPELCPTDAAGLRPDLKEIARWPGAATLWDTGAGPALFEIEREDGLISPAVLTALDKALGRVMAGHSGLVLTSNHPQLFAFGASGPFRETIRTGDTAPSLAFLREGQSVLMAMRDAPFPTVAAIHGAAFSGACELALYASGLVVEERARIGLKEIWLGLIPGWGGDIQLLLRHLAAGEDPLTAACSTFTQCARGHVARGAAEGRSAHLLREHDRTVASRDRLIPEAISLASSLASGLRRARPAAPLRIPLPADAEALRAHVAALDAELGFSPAERTAMQTLLALYTYDPGTAVDEARHMARAARAFLPLLSPGLAARAAHFAATGQRMPADP